MKETQCTADTSLFSEDPTVAIVGSVLVIALGVAGGLLPRLWRSWRRGTASAE